MPPGVTAVPGAPPATPVSSVTSASSRQMPQSAQQLVDVSSRLQTPSPHVPGTAASIGVGAASALLDDCLPHAPPTMMAIAQTLWRMRQVYRASAASRTNNAGRLGQTRA